MHRTGHREPMARSLNRTVDVWRQMEPPALRRFENAASHKFFVGLGDRSARDAERKCKLALRRQLVAGLYDSVLGFCVELRVCRLQEFVSLLRRLHVAAMIDEFLDREIIGHGVQPRPVLAEGQDIALTLMPGQGDYKLPSLGIPKPDRSINASGRQASSIRAVQKSWRGERHILIIWNILVNTGLKARSWRKQGEIPDSDDVIRSPGCQVAAIEAEREATDALPRAWPG